LLVEFLLERVRRQFDWNVGLNGRASILLALTGIALTLLLGNERGVAEGSDLEVGARAVGLALLIVSAVVLLRALRRRSEAVWGMADLDTFIAANRDRPGDEVLGALIDRLGDGTHRNEAVLASKSREIEFGLTLTLAGLLFAAVGSVGNTGVPVLLAVAAIGFVAVWLSTSQLERSGGSS
jgi:hypothetical protein